MALMKSIATRRATRKILLSIGLLLLFSIIIGCGAMSLKKKINSSVVKIEEIVGEFNDRVNEQDTRELGNMSYNKYVLSVRQKIIHIQDSIKMRISTLPQTSKDELNVYYKDKFNDLYSRLRIKYPMAMEQLQLE